MQSVLVHLCDSSLAEEDSLPPIGPCIARFETPDQAIEFVRSHAANVYPKAGFDITDETGDGGEWMFFAPDCDIWYFVVDWADNYSADLLFSLSAGAGASFVTRLPTLYDAFDFAAIDAKRLQPNVTTWDHPRLTHQPGYRPEWVITNQQNDTCYIIVDRR